MNKTYILCQSNKMGSRTSQLGGAVQAMEGATVTQIDFEQATGFDNRGVLHNLTGPNCNPEVPANLAFRIQRDDELSTVRINAFGRQLGINGANYAQCSKKLALTAFPETPFKANNVFGKRHVINGDILSFEADGNPMVISAIQNVSLESRGSVSEQIARLTRERDEINAKIEALQNK